MSAPQRAAKPKPNAPPGPRLVAPRFGGRYQGRTAEQVAATLRRSKWNCVPLLPDLGPISRGVCQAMLLLWVHLHSAGGARGKGEAALDWTDPSLPLDIAKAIRFSVQEVRADIEDALARGLLERKGNSGFERYQLRLRYKALPGIPRLARAVPGEPETAESASISNRSANRECSASYEDSSDKQPDPEPLALAAPPEPVVLPAETGSQVLELTVPSPREVRVECRNRTSLPISIASSISDSGALCIDLLPFVQPAQPPGPPEIFVSAPGWRDLARAVGEVTDRLGERLYLDEREASHLVAKLEAPLAFWQETAPDRLEREMGKGRRLACNVIGYTVTNANAKWEALGPEGREAWGKPKPAGTAPLFEERESADARKLRERRERRESWPTS